MMFLLSYFRIYYKLDGSHQYVETGVLAMNQWYKVEVEQRLVLDKVSLSECDPLTYIYNI